MDGIDRVRVRELELFAEVGVYPHEHGRKQRLLMDIEVHTQLAKAGTTDALEHAVDYDALAEAARTVVSARHHKLIEAIAEETAQAVLSACQGVASAVRVRVEKPRAVVDARTVEVEIVRRPKDSEP